MDLNVSFIRQVQASILDPTNAFDMNSWECCIGGHCGKILRESGKFRAVSLNDLGPGTYYGNALGIDFRVAQQLFTINALEQRFDRLGACERLEALVKAAEPPAPAAPPSLRGTTQEPSLRGKARSRSPRATPKPAAADMAAIDAILQEAEAEVEPVLV